MTLRERYHGRIPWPRQDMGSLPDIQTVCSSELVEPARRPLV